MKYFKTLLTMNKIWSLISSKLTLMRRKLRGKRQSFIKNQLKTLLLKCNQFKKQMRSIKHMKRMLMMKIITLIQDLDFQL